MRHQWEAILPIFFLLTFFSGRFVDWIKTVRSREVPVLRGWQVLILPDEDEVCSGSNVHSAIRYFKVAERLAHWGAEVLIFHPDLEDPLISRNGLSKKRFPLILMVETSVTEKEGGRYGYYQGKLWVVTPAAPLEIPAEVVETPFVPDDGNSEKRLVEQMALAVDRLVPRVVRYASYWKR